MAKFTITHPDKVLFPKDPFTKEDLINYYTRVAPSMLPLMKNRPVTMERYPNGIHHKGFIQKQVPSYFPSWITTHSIPRKGQTSIPMLICNTKDTLNYLINQDCITPHIWLSKKSSLNTPNRMIFDLDPPKSNFYFAIEAACELRALLETTLKLTPFIMTTGSKGLHIVIPIKQEYTFSEVRNCARSIGKIIVDNNPKRYTLNPLKSKRGGRLFIDYLRNSYAQMTVAPYAIRPLNGAPIAMPIPWSALKPSLSPTSYHLKNIKRSLSKHPWSSIEKSARSLKNAMRRL